jgi:hypothetical protein
MCYYLNHYKHSFDDKWIEIADELNISPAIVIAIVEQIKDIAAQQLRFRGSIEYCEIGKIAVYLRVQIEEVKSIFEKLEQKKFLKKISATIFKIANWTRYQPTFSNTQKNSAKNSATFSEISAIEIQQNSDNIFRFKNEKSARNRFNYISQKVKENKDLKPKEQQDYDLLLQHFSAKISDTPKKIQQNSDSEKRTIKGELELRSKDVMIIDNGGEDKKAKEEKENEMANLIAVLCDQHDIIQNDFTSINAMASYAVSKEINATNNEIEQVFKDISMKLQDRKEVKNVKYIAGNKLGIFKSSLNQLRKSKEMVLEVQNEDSQFNSLNYGNGNKFNNTASRNSKKPTGYILHTTGTPELIE